MIQAKRANSVTCSLREYFLFHFCSDIDIHLSIHFIVMYFLFSIFCFLSVLDHVVSREPPCENFTFHSMALGHSGALVSWEPNGTQCDFTCFDYDYLRLKIGNDTVGMETNESTGFATYEASSCDGYLKIHSLNENTNYKIQIYRIDFDVKSESVRIHTMKLRTSLKTDGVPAKPYFEYIVQGIVFPIIRWYPCGKERNCGDKVTGTHFGITIQDIDANSRLTEVYKEELSRDYYSIIFWPGRIYKVVVYSINGESKTPSDSQEIFIRPISTPVTHANVLSLSHSSVMVHWKAPKHTLETVDYMIFHYDSSGPHSDELDLVLVADNFRNISSGSVSTVDGLSLRITNLKRHNTYTYIIIPCSQGKDVRVGLEYRMKYTHQVYDDDLKIATPDFNYRSFPIRAGNCRIFFQWLPCGKSFDCKNAKPGSNYSLTTKPTSQLKYFNNSYNFMEYDCTGSFEENLVYEITIRSSIGNNFSESVTKKFKNCELYHESQ